MLMWGVSFIKMVSTRGSQADRYEVNLKLG